MESNSLRLTIITTIAVFISFLQECIAWSKCKLKGMKFIKNKSGLKFIYDEDDIKNCYIIYYEICKNGIPVRTHPSKMKKPYAWLTYRPKGNIMELCIHPENKYFKYDLFDYSIFLKEEQKIFKKFRKNDQWKLSYIEKDELF
jgi:hypothetical protein